MGRTSPYVFKEQEFAFFRFSFDAGTCSSLPDFSGPCTKHLSHVSSFQLDPANTPMSCSFSCAISLVQDLRPIFHWNTKQLFLYLSAEYNNTQGVCSHLPCFNVCSPRKRVSNVPLHRAISNSSQTHSAFQFQIINEVVIWDRIVRRKEDAIIHIDNVSNKYAVREISKSFRCAECFNFSPSFLATWVPGNAILVDLSLCHHPNLFSSSRSERWFYRNAAEVQFVLKYNVMPHVGVLTYGEAGRMENKVAFPALSSR